MRRGRRIRPRRACGQGSGCTALGDGTGWALCDSAGYTLVETLFVAGLVTILAAVSVPQLTAGLERARARAAARYRVAQMSAVRLQALKRSSAMALRFQRGPGGVLVSVHVDGNRNGVRSAEISSGIDPVVESAVRLEDLFPGVTIAVPVDASASAVDLGGTELLTFTPAGTATSGTVHVLGRDGTRFAVRILGTTGRIRLLRFEPRISEWTESF